MVIILAPIALFLLILVYILHFIFSMFFDIKHKKWFKLYSSRMYKKAKLIDIFSNYIFPDLWNWMYSIKGNNYKFGKLGETLSSVLGKKKLEKSLSLTGLLFYSILYIIDFDSWKLCGHCIRWIMTEEQINNIKN